MVLEVIIKQARTLMKPAIKDTIEGLALDFSEAAYRAGAKSVMSVFAKMSADEILHEIEEFKKSQEQ